MVSPDPLAVKQSAVAILAAARSEPQAGADVKRHRAPEQLRPPHSARPDIGRTPTKESDVSAACPGPVVRSRPLLHRMAISRCAPSALTFAADRSIERV